jgi:hypothetical protein
MRRDRWFVRRGYRLERRGVVVGGGATGADKQETPPVTGPEDEEDDDEFLDHPAPITAGVAVTALSLATSLARDNEYRRVNPLDGT